MILIVIPCEQWFLSCMAFSIYKVILGLVYHASGSIEQTNYATGKVHERLCKH